MISYRFHNSYKRFSRTNTEKKDAGSDETGVIIFHVYSKIFSTFMIIFFRLNGDHEDLRVAYRQITQYFFHLRIMLKFFP